MLALDVPVGLGTDATRVASYNPWTALYWLVSGRTVGGMAMYDDANRLPRDVALELWTAGSAWFSSEQGKKGRLAAGQLADLVVLSKDYFSVAEEEIKGIESVLTVVDGKVVYAAGHSPLAPPPIPVLPEWSPVVKVPAITVPLRRRRLKSAPWCRCTSAAVAVASTAISMILRVSRRFRSLTSRPSGACWAVPALLLIPETTAPAASGRWFQPQARRQ